MKRATAFFLLTTLVAATAAASNIVPNRFIIVDEVYDVQRFQGGPTISWRGWDFSTIGGQTVGTHARVISAQDDGPFLSQYDADHGAKKCLTSDYLTVADAASGLTAGKPVILDLSHVLFEPIDFQSGDWELRTDWLTRLQTFADHAQGRYNADTTLFIVVFSEVTGTDLINADINQAAIEVKARFPAGVKVAAAYPTTTPDNVAHLPAQFPPGLDLIVTWDYSVGEPRQLPYYDPSWPENPSTPYGKLVNALRWFQDIYFLAPIFNDGNVQGAASRIHQNTSTYFGTVLRNWCAFSLKKHTGRHAGLILWKYNDGYGCTQQGSCATNCPGIFRSITGAQTTFEYEASQGIDALARAYRAVSRAAALGTGCFVP